MAAPIDGDGQAAFVGHLWHIPTLYQPWAYGGASLLRPDVLQVPDSNPESAPNTLPHHVQQLIIMPLQLTNKLQLMAEHGAVTYILNLLQDGEVRPTEGEGMRA